MLIDLYMSGKLRLDEMVSQEYRLDQINEAYEAMRVGDSARGVVIF
jgi:S-(hydroxymethyl)glutathione dehydrogenase/alcohol dehydrogenase